MLVNGKVASVVLAVALLCMAPKVPAQQGVGVGLPISRACWPGGWEKRHSPGSFTFAAHQAFFEAEHRAQGMAGGDHLRTGACGVGEALKVEPDQPRDECEIGASA